MTTHFSYLDPALQEELSQIAQAMVAPGKGILAADEAISDLGKRLENIGLQNTEENRRKYRSMLFTSDIGSSVAAVILRHEMVYEKTDDGTPFVEALKKRGVIAGINVDKEPVPLMGSEDEVTTQGLDDLAQRVAQYKKDGCQFAKWRCVIKITKNNPSYLALTENANVLARYAAICQANRVVPIVEPDIVLAGDHDLERAQKVTEVLMSFVYKALSDHHVFLEGTVLKPSMVLAGPANGRKYSPAEVGAATVTAMRRTVPAAVAGIAFLSGGQSADDSTLNLNAINTTPANKPWPLTFCFGRALLDAVITTWAGKNEKIPTAQAEFITRCINNSRASVGKFQL